CAPRACRRCYSDRSPSSSASRPRRDPFSAISPSVVVLALRPAAHDVLVGRLPVPRPETLGRLAPRRRGMPSVLTLAPAATERVIHGIHGDAARDRAASEPAALAGLA